MNYGWWNCGRWQAHAPLRTWGFQSAIWRIGPARYGTGLESTASGFLFTRFQITSFPYDTNRSHELPTWLFCYFISCFWEASARRQKSSRLDYSSYRGCRPGRIPFAPAFDFLVLPKRLVKLFQSVFAAVDKASLADRERRNLHRQLLLLALRDGPSWEWRSRRLNCWHKDGAGTIKATLAVIYWTAMDKEP